MVLQEPIECGPAICCTTDHLDRYQISPSYELDAVREIHRQATDSAGRQLSSLGLLLVPYAKVAELRRLGVPRMCRDAVALSHICGGVELNAHHRQDLDVAKADYFDSLPVVLGRDTLMIRTPSLASFGHGLAQFRTTLPVYLTHRRATSFRCDIQLLAALDRTIRAFTSGRQRPELRQVFRAITIALHASRVLTEREATYIDLGPRIAAWVSAFETVVHRGKGDKVNLRRIVDFIQKIGWFDGRPAMRGAPKGRKKEIAHRRFICEYRDTKWRVNAACDLYSRLYTLRNDVAHGNPIQRDRFFVRPRARPITRIDEVLPLLFRECVLERLREIGFVKPWPTGNLSPREFAEYFRESRKTSNAHDALAVALFGRQP